MDSSLSKIIITLLVIGGTLYAFSPQAGLIRPTASVDDAVAARTLPLDIKNRTLADPRQGDLAVKVGERAILQVTTDEDGKLDLISGDRDTFNPIFSGTVNSLTVSTDKPGSWTIKFRPGATPDQTGEPITIGTIVVES